MLFTRMFRNAESEEMVVGGATGQEVPFHNNIIGIISWFIDTELKQIYCSYSRTQKIQKGFLLLFLRSTLLLKRNKYNW